MPESQLPFLSIMVASDNDPWVKFSTAVSWADRWGSRLVRMGNKGHLNAECGFGPWPAGLAIYQSLLESCEGLSPGRPEEAKADSGRSRSGLLARMRQHALDQWATFSRLVF
jgi:hypothetical protein